MRKKHGRAYFSQARSKNSTDRTPEADRMDSSPLRFCATAAANAQTLHAYSRACQLVL